MRALCIVQEWFIADEGQDLKPFTETQPSFSEEVTIVKRRMIDGELFYQLLEYNRLNEYYQASCFVPFENQNIERKNLNRNMKNVIAIFICMLMAYAAASQRTDTTSKLNTPSNQVQGITPVKKDTTFVPLFEKKDTAKADGRKTVLYLAPDGYVRHMQGYPVTDGWVKQTGENKFDYITQPQVIGAVDERGRNIPRITGFSDPYPPIPLPVKPQVTKKK